MNIVTIPHPSLRKKTLPITKVDTKLKKFIADLEQTLDQKRNPPGVGLAAPQVDRLWRVFVTKLPADRQSDNTNSPLRSFINPSISKTSNKQTLGPDPKKPDLEGCLSMPRLYGPVPRYDWVEVEWQEVVGDQLIKRQEKFEQFQARVMQHEVDHLDGILFTDHCLKHDLPVYKEDEDGEMIEIARSLVEII